MLLVLALLFGVLELVSRKFEARLSADVRQMLSQEEIPEGVGGARSRGRESVLILGNSLARAGLLDSGIRKRFVELGKAEPEIFYITPDGSDISDWTAAFRKCFPVGAKAPAPDYLLIGTGETHLEDRPVVSPEKLAAYHAAPADRGMILRQWLENNGERVRFLAASASRCFANRERLRPILFYNYVPGYEEVSRRVNDLEKSGKGPAGRGEATANRFQLLLESVPVPRERILVAAIPLPWAYRLDDAVVGAAAKHGIRIHEADAAREWPESAFPDGYHLGAEPGADYTEEVMAELLP